MKYKKVYLISFAIFFILMGVYFYIENKYSSKSVAPDLDKDYAAVAIEEANNALANARNPVAKIDTTTVDVYDTEAIKLVKNKNFVDVAEKPVDPMTQLAELAKSKNKVYVNLSEKDLDKKINLYENIKKSEKISSVVVPDMGKDLSNITPVYAPCDYKVFKTSASWNAFISHNRVREKPSVDFSKENIVTIVSKSDLPPGIFKIDSFNNKDRVITILYRVDVLEIADDNPNSTRDFYSIVKIPSNYSRIEIKQIQ